MTGSRPVCHNCFRPYRKGQNYCASCGRSVGPYVDHLPGHAIWEAPFRGGSRRARRVIWSLLGCAYVACLVHVLLRTDHWPLLAVPALITWIVYLGTRSPDE